MEKLLKLFSFQPRIERREDPVKCLIISQPMSYVEATDNVKIIESLPGVSKLISSLRAEIEYLTKENDKLYKELDNLESQL